MKIKNVVFLISMVILNVGCQNESSAFEMTVEKVEELKGFVLKGVAISGPIKSGCVANNDEISVKRDGKEILKTTARVLDATKKGGAKYSENDILDKGDKVHFYIPDTQQDAVKVGDVVSSSTSACEK